MKPTTDKLKIDLDVYVNRCHIAMGDYRCVLKQTLLLKMKMIFVFSSKVISGIKEQAPTALQAVKLLATFLSQSEQKDMVLMTLNDWLNDPNSGQDHTLKLVAGIIYLNQGEIKDALKTLKNNPTLEM